MIKTLENWKANWYIFSLFPSIRCLISVIYFSQRNYILYISSWVNMYVMNKNNIRERERERNLNYYKWKITKFAAKYFVDVSCSKVSDYVIARRATKTMFTYICIHFYTSTLSTFPNNPLYSIQIQDRIYYTRYMRFFVKAHNFITLYVVHNFKSRYVARSCKLCYNFEDKFRVKFAHIIVVRQQQH